MRHSASLLASLEGTTRAGYRIAKELTNNSRSGLTVRFLSKKLDIPEEEIEYLLDMNHRLLFTDLTKVKLVSEGYNAVKRVSDGLENHGDAAALIRRLKGLSPHDFRWLEERLGIDQPVTKKAAVDLLLEQCYRHPDSVVAYVATRGFSETAREIFDIVWQSKDGLLSVSQIRTAHGGAEYAVEEALAELFRGFALFEMFRFDTEDRLVRVAGLLSEIRQLRESAARKKGGKARLKPVRSKPDAIECRGLDFSDTLCKLIAAVAARPVRLRGDGDLFREDRRRLAEICPEDAEPSLNTCLWVAEGAGWLARVDNTLCAGELEALIRMDRVSRHRALADWMSGHGDEAPLRSLLRSLLDEIRPGAWHTVSEFIGFALQAQSEHDQPVLRPAGAHWQYVSPAVSGQTENRLARAMEGTLFWLGILDRGEAEGESVFRITDLGAAILKNEDDPRLEQQYPPRTGEFVVQPNFDIVVPTQDVDPLLTVPLDQFAVRVSTGQATVYNVTRETFTGAMQSGHDPNAFVEFLLAHCRGGALPANVMMTLEDWRGAMKRVRLRTLHVLESDDPLVLADLLHRRRFSKHFTPIDPKKIVRFLDIPKAELAKLLEKDGFIVE